jgi:methylthioribose-1-phosphate isomerase
MNVDGVPTRTVRGDPERGVVEVIDQTLLPHEYRWVRLTDVDEAAEAIRGMQVRGAPLIGVTAAYGLALAASADPGDAALDAAAALLVATRPTAVNLQWAVRRMRSLLADVPVPERAQRAWSQATAMAEEDVATNRAIGRHGLELLRTLTVPQGRALSVMTHCNAGWLATVDHGTALSPVYAAVGTGIPVHVWVSETRPRNQGLLTAWELARHGVPHSVVTDSAAGPLLRQGLVDAVIVGADRVAANGDVANKVGTYLKALACRDNGVPCYVAAPGSTIDFACPSGDGIPIEERSGDEVRLVRGTADGSGLDAGAGAATVRQLPEDEPVRNPAFDVTPARLVTALITERGVCAATVEGLRGLYPSAAGR